MYLDSDKTPDRSGLLVAKYADHLPLYRQSEVFARNGLDLDRPTLSDWVGQAAWLLDPVATEDLRWVKGNEIVRRPRGARPDRSGLCH